MSRWEWPPDGWYARAEGAAFYAGFVYGMLAALAVCLLFGGCGGKQRQLPGVLPVAITAWPSPIRPKCELPDLPQVPDVFVWTQISEEEAGRVYINQRQLADLVVWLKDVQMWSSLTTRCLEKMTEPD